MNIYVFDVKYSHITRLVQCNPIPAYTYNQALAALYNMDKVDGAILIAVKNDGCWKRGFMNNPTQYDIQIPEES
jgi:hypothetical protein